MRNIYYIDSFSHLTKNSLRTCISKGSHGTHNHSCLQDKNKLQGTPRLKLEWESKERGKDTLNNLTIHTIPHLGVNPTKVTMKTI